jgi:hypothetical protein
MTSEESKALCARIAASDQVQIAAVQSELREEILPGAKYKVSAVQPQGLCIDAREAVALIINNENLERIVDRELIQQLLEANSLVVDAIAQATSYSGLGYELFTGVMDEGGFDEP